MSDAASTALAAIAAAGHLSLDPRSSTLLVGEGFAPVDVDPDTAVALVAELGDTLDLHPAVHPLLLHREGDDGTCRSCGQPYPCLSLRLVDAPPTVE